MDTPYAQILRDTINTAKEEDEWPPYDHVRGKSKLNWMYPEEARDTK